MNWGKWIAVSVFLMGIALALVTGVAIELLITAQSNNTDTLRTLAITSSCLALIFLWAGIYFIPRMRLRQSGNKKDPKGEPEVP
jgi:hypothetical protein